MGVEVMSEHAFSMLVAAFVAGLCVGVIVTCLLFSEWGESGRRKQ